MTVGLAPWYVGLEEQLCGSIFACPPARRIDAARTLVDAGIVVHVDVMAPGEGLPQGITAAELTELAADVPVDLLDVHLIGSADGVARLLDDLPDCRTLFVPLGTRADVSGRLWATVWNKFDDVRPTASDVGGYGGVLVMLIEPGSMGVADPDRLALVQQFAALTDVGVDGGITPDLIPLCQSAGATTIVVGRALLEGHQ